jgi:Pyruvate/2-oxoacid:ferredoxin oxidoreductase gamma subunit
MAEVIFSPNEILYTGISKPDAVIALSPEGLQKALPYIQLLSDQGTLILSLELPNVNTPASKILLDPQEYGSWGKKREYRAMIAFALLLQAKGIFPIEALEEAIRLNPRFAQANLAAVKAVLG